ncbi:MAG: glycosyltransferase family 4 protein [Chloroflexota bacterium]|nr:glycosyltransferase family 4 protein [Chloroflexota bacterium]MDE2840229.1 glycosyltransferase family 4 protein [Chloroflexota bacterium]MDE2929415.1 glycosyltransferase family 4 protein [Chloroflexota bacterium]
MRILYLTTYYLPHSSGITAYLHCVARALVQRGHTVTVLTSRHDPALSDDESLDGVRIIRLPVLFRVSKGPVMPTFFWDLRQYLQTHDVVHVHLPFLESAYAALLNRGRIPLILTVHADLHLPAGFSNRLASAAVNVMQRFAARRADWLCSFTWDFAQHSDLLADYLDKTLVIHPPVTVAASNPADVAAFRKRHALEGTLIGFSGRFAEQKGLHVLFDALAHVLQRMPHARLALAGEYRNVVGEDYYERLRPRLEKFGDRVALLGHLDGKDLASFYAACDVLVLPSINPMETFGLVQVEAMLCDTPVVATDFPGGRQAVRLTGMGRIAPPRDSTALAAALLAVLQNPGHYTKPREEIERVFNYERAIDLHEELYRSNRIVKDDRAFERANASHEAGQELKVV